MDGVDIAWINNMTVLCSNGQTRELSSREGSDVGKDANGREVLRRKLTYFLFHSLRSNKKAHCYPLSGMIVFFK